MIIDLSYKSHHKAYLSQIIGKGNGKNAIEERDDQFGGWWHEGSAFALVCGQKSSTFKRH